MAAHTMSLTRAAAMQAAAADVRRLNRVGAVALSFLLYGLVMAYLLVGSLGTWTGSRPADAPFSIPAPVVLQQPVFPPQPVVDGTATEMPPRPQAGFAPR